MDLDKLHNKIILPFPPSQLMPNRKKSRSWKSTINFITKFKDDSYYITLASKIKLENKQTELSIVFYPPDNRGRDLDNLFSAMKPIIDGFALALGINDKHFRPIKLDIGPADKKAPRVEIEIVS